MGKFTERPSPKPGISKFSYVCFLQFVDNERKYIDEKELILRVAGGDENAFRQITSLYFDKLIHFIFGITGSRPLTEEITQDVLLKIWQNREKLKELQSFDAWIFIVARNRCYDCLTQLARERNRREKWEQEVLATMNEADSAAEPALFHRYAELLDEAIEHLPPQQKLIYQLSRQQHLTSADISEKTSLSIDTIKKHRSRAIKNIKSYLTRYLNFFF